MPAPYITLLLHNGMHHTTNTNPSLANCYHYHHFHFLSSDSIMAVDSVTSSPLGPPATEKDAKVLQFIEETTKNTDAVQERVLSEILSQNAETEYLKRFGLNGATDRDTFKSKIPVVTYEDLQPEIQRIANGDHSPILSSHPISEFLTRYYYNCFLSSSFFHEY